MTIPVEVKKRIQDADVRIAHLEGLLGKWCDYCNFAGVAPVSAHVEDNPVLTLRRDSLIALGRRSTNG